MRRNEAFKIPEDQVDEPSMEIQVGKTESDVASLKVDVREFRADMKAANESIAEIKTAVAIVDGKIDTVGAELNGKIAALSAETSGKFDALNAKVEGNTKDIAKLDAKVSKLDERVIGACDNIADLKAMLKAVLCAMGIGLLGAIGKTFSWI